MRNDFRLRDYQIDHAAYHIRHRASLNRSACATGKTATMAFLTEFYWETEKAKTVLINPISLSVKNRDEFLRFTNFDESEIAIVRGTPKKREKIYSDSNVKVFIVGADTFGNEWKKFPKDVKNCIVDESHLAYSTHSSKRTQEFYKAQVNFDHVLFCTATPLGSGRYDACYPLFAVCDPMRYGSHKRFLAYHAIYNSLGYLVSWRNGEDLGDGLRRFSCGISFEEAYPNASENIISVETCDFEDDEQFRIYKELEESAMAELEDRYIESANPAVNAMRCRQAIECPEAIGYTPKVYGKDELLKSHLQRILDNSEQSMLIFSCFIAEQERIVKICESMGISVELINGSTSSAKRGEIAKRFMTNETKVLVASPATMAVGFNFEQVDSIIFVSCTYNNSDFHQCVFRGNRGSRKRALPVYILRYDCKIEKRIWDVVLARKEKESQKVSQRLVN